MTKFSPKPSPSREDVLAFIARERAALEASGVSAPAKVGKREIARAFGLKGDDRIALKRLLRELEEDGALARRGKRFSPAQHLPPVAAAVFVGVDEDGALIAQVAAHDADEGAAARIRIPLRRAHRDDAPPGIGDRVLLRVEPEPAAAEAGAAYQGRVLKNLGKAKPALVALFKLTPSGGRLTPIDKKGLGREWIVAERDRGEAQDGDLVSAEILREGRMGLPGARVIERLGALSSERAISQIAIHAHRIPHVFHPDALTEADRARAATMAGREDWRDVALVTIDPADAKDHDDAVFAAPDDDPANPGGHVLLAAIADVAAYVRTGSALDREALERGNSVYFPDRVVPMLPERISNDLCSLRPNEDRPALAVRIVVDRDGAKRGHSFHRVMMRSAGRLSYQSAQAAMEGAPNEAAPLAPGVLRPLYDAYAALTRARKQRSPLDLDLPERKLLLKSDGSLDRVVVPPRLDSHRLIEEFMILANVAAAETLEEKRQALIYRAHDEPTLEKTHALIEFLATLGIKLAKGQALRPAHFNRILDQVRGGPNEILVNEVVLRSQAQAEYTPQNYGHFGLNLRRYAHFTSPIRRYADLIVHRALIKALNLGDDGLPDLSAKQMVNIAEKISLAERRAMLAERDTADRLIAAHLSQQIGAEFQGRISGVTRAGLFVKLADTGADGFIPASTLGNDFFRHEEGMHALVGARGGETFRLGDSVVVRLVEAAPIAGALRFEMVSEGQAEGNRRALALKGKSMRRDKAPPYVAGRAGPDGKRSRRIRKSSP